MLLFNIDLDEADRNLPDHRDEGDLEDAGEDDVCQAFFDLRQRTLVGMEPLPAFRVVALGLLRKLRTSPRSGVLYAEVEDALGRYFRLLDVEMQRFASLHETLRAAVDRDGRFVAERGSSAAAAVEAALALLHEGMRQIAVVLLACGDMQKRALDLKMGAQRSVSQSEHDSPPLASFSRFAEFLEEALAVEDQLRRKHEELQQLRMRAMASVVDARASMAAASAASPASGTGVACGPQVLGNPSSPKSGQGSALATATAS
mmetsp:Transcript_1038/g.2614  ORF Transcript_1038/g.2614 Transcript_1038/m.2614 type:complete len:260 (-) Transcript_1038:21-800(-)